MQTRTMALGRTENASQAFLLAQPLANRFLRKTKQPTEQPQNHNLILVKQRSAAMPIKP